MRHSAVPGPLTASPLESEDETSHRIPEEPEVHWRSLIPYRRTCAFVAGPPSQGLVGSQALASYVSCLLPFAAYLRALCCRV